MTSLNAIPQLYDSLVSVFTGSSQTENRKLSEPLTTITVSEEEPFLSTFSEKLSVISENFSDFFSANSIDTSNQGREDTEEEIVDSLLEHDYVAYMSPRKRYPVIIKIRSIKKAKPKAVEPEDFL